MKVVHVIPNLLKGGAERLVIDICNELASRDDIEIKLIVFSKENLYEELTKNLIIVHCPVKYRLSISGKNEIDITSYSLFIDSFQPDIIHSHLFKAEIITRAKTESNIKYFTHLHDNMPQFEKWKISTFLEKERITNFYERNKLLKAYKKCNNQFISISKNTSTFFAQNLPKKLQKITLLPNAINVDLFTKPKSWTRNKKQGILQLVTVGSLVDKKNQVFLIEIVKRLIEQGINPKLQILGDGPNRNKIEVSIKKNKLEKHIELKGSVNKVEEYLWNADIYLHSATYEPFGLAILEAMAAGLPCICIDGGGNRDIITNEENGFIIDKGNPEHFTKCIIRLHKDKDLHSYISNKGIQFVKNYSIDKYADKLISIYKSNTNVS